MWDLDPVGDGESTWGSLLAGRMVLPPGRSRSQRAQAREKMVNEEVGVIVQAQVGVALMEAAYAAFLVSAWANSQDPVSPGP